MERVSSVHTTSTKLVRVSVRRGLVPSCRFRNRDRSRGLVLLILVASDIMYSMSASLESGTYYFPTLPAFMQVTDLNYIEDHSLSEPSLVLRGSRWAESYSGSVTSMCDTHLIAAALLFCFSETCEIMGRNVLFI